MKPTQTVQIPIPDAASLDLKTPGGESFDNMVQLRVQAKEQIKELEALVAQWDAAIGATLDLNQIKTVSWNGEYVVSRREPSKPRQTLDRSKLLELGVPATTIQQATIFGKPGKPGIVIRKVTEGEEDANSGVDGSWTN